MDNGIERLGNIDNLTFNYFEGQNRLKSITEDATDAQLKQKGFNPRVGSGEYSYDASGNLISDSYKGITIQYNHLNLPEKVTKGSETITWLYDATGTKLQKKVNTNTAIPLSLTQNPIPNNTYTGSTITASGKATSGNITFTATQSIDLTVGFEATPAFFASIGTSGNSITTTQDYVGGIEYKNTTLEAMYHAEGRAYRNGSTWQYEYTLKDHLGNSRVTFSDLDNNGTINPTTEILQENHYYPFGMNQEGNWSNNVKNSNKYQFNGIEQIEDLGLMNIGYAARFYNPALARFTGVDMLAEANEYLNPYNFAALNPMSNVDFMGLTDADGDGKDDGNVLPDLVVKAKRIDKRVENAQTALDIIGLVPVAQTVAGLANAGIDTYQGNYGSALVNVGTSIPFAGYVVKAVKIISPLIKAKALKGMLASVFVMKKGKYGTITSQFDKGQIHHIIPQKLQEPFQVDFTDANFHVDIDNLVDLPTPFHGKHPAYTENVKKRIQEMIDNNGNISLEDIKSLQNDLLNKINDAYKNFNLTGENLNTYFKK